MILGNTNEFAIEVENYNKVKNVAKVRLFFNGKVHGSFKRIDKISPLLNTLNAILTAGNDLYDVSFDGRSQEEIFSIVCVLHAEIGNLSDEDYEQMERYQRFGFNWGEQFNDTGTVVYIREGICNILWSTNRNFSEKIDYMKNFMFTQFPVSYITRVRDEFVAYLNQ